jgi:putative sigma-54 modulation protein
MQVIVKARHTRVPDSLKEQAVHKIEKVRRFFDRITKLEIEFSEEHNPRVANRHAVEVTLSTKAHLLRAKAAGPDPSSAVDAVVDKLEAQVKRLKGKITKRGRGGASPPETIRIPRRARGQSGNSTQLTDGSLPIESARSGLGPRVRRTGRFSVEPMTPEEAALLMDSSGEGFMPFVNAETEQVSVVYRMDDGSYGLVEPAE